MPPAKGGGMEIIMKNRIAVRVIAGACMLVGCVGFLLKGNYLSAGLFGILAVVFFVTAFKGKNNE